MNNRNLEKVRNLLADSRSESANIDKLHALYHLREHSKYIDYNDTLDDYTKEKNSDDSQDEFLKRLTKSISPSDGESEGKYTEEKDGDTTLEDKMYYDFVNKLTNNIHEDKIYYIFIAELTLKTISENCQPDIESDIVKNKQREGKYLSQFSEYSRLVITNERILVFTLSCKISDITKDSEWLLAADLPFEKIEEILYHEDPTEQFTLITEEEKLHAYFISVESQVEMENAMDYIGNNAGLEPRIELSEKFDNEIYHEIKRDLYKRKDSVQHWWLLPYNNNGVAWGIEENLEMSGIEESQKAHEEATKRTPPVDIGDVVKMGVIDLTTHHQKGKEAVCEVEGFKIFVQIIPSDLDLGDIILSKIVSYNRGRTSGKAIFIRDCEEEENNSE